MKKFIKNGIFCLLILIVLNVRGQIGGESTYAFLTLPAPARIAALGGEMVPFYDDDLNIAYQNPAALNPDMHNSLSLSTVAYLGGISYGYAGYARDFEKLGTFMIGVQYINYGEFIGANSIGWVPETFTAGEQAVNIGWGMKKDNFIFGASVKAINSSLAAYRSFGVGTDLSWGYIIPDESIVITAALKNLGWQLTTYTDGNREPLPFDIQAGISKKLEHLPLNLFLSAHDLYRWDIRYDDPESQQGNSGFGFGEDEPPKPKSYFVDKLMRHVVIGGELSIGKYVDFRLAYNHQRRQEMKVESRLSTVGYSWGFGVTIKKIRIEYGSAKYHLAGSSNNFSLSLNLDDILPKKQKNNHSDS